MAIPPPSEPRSNKKETLVSVRLSDEEVKQFRHTVSLYKILYAPKHKKRGITDSDVLRAALIVLREELIKTISENPLFSDEELENLKGP